ncbi:hypothetical protein [Gluconacetobacter takamatsuzukensis]|uniref:Uncharacterized protein n=1 Tax=Gluconacetobacter takamatsuzukensis TaxID=1286190 RepID=A0A7W4KE25_9PROT|nr:hypothetical protein [Gluconacetobacter takamatsuzukensis]MBB2205160.1 hypothetical protein [Gluconacetobacter takamatsuzukensis]
MFVTALALYPGGADGLDAIEWVYFHDRQRVASSRCEAAPELIDLPLTAWRGLVVSFDSAWGAMRC